MDDDDIEDWQQCALWLERCQVLSNEQTGSIYSVDNLASYMRDGVLLCHLINRLSPRAIDAKNFSQRPQMSQFLCLKNIRAFLQACKKTFGMRDRDLFEPYDLFDMKNFGKVIQTLADLSQTKEAKKTNIEPFTADEAEYVILDTAFEDELIYMPVGGNDCDDDDDAEDVYGKLVDFQHTAPVARPGLTKKDHCLNELVDTEKNYLDVLAMIIEKFLKPLQRIIPASDCSIIFFGIEPLYSTHTKFHSDLVRARNQTTGHIAKCFTDHKMNLLIYGDFCSKIEASHTHLQQICDANRQAKELIEAKNVEAKVKLRDLLTVPVQRILKYHLIVKELIKHSDQRDEVEKGQLNDALEAMEDLALYINEVKRDNENLVLIKEIQDSIVDLDRVMRSSMKLQDYGRRLHDGEYKVNGKQRYIFLFDKIMILCKTSRNFYNYRGNIIISKYDLKDEPTSSAKERCIALVSPGNPADKWAFQAKPDLIRKLEDALALAIDNIKPEGAEENGFIFQISTFNEPTSCSICKKLLRGVFNQGYRCRNTGMSVHKECITKAGRNPARRKQGNSGYEETEINVRPPVGSRPPATVPSLPPRRTPASSTISDIKNKRISTLSGSRESNLNDYPWFDGTADRVGSENLLGSFEDGTFMVRIGRKQEYVLSVMYSSVRHLIIKHENGKYILGTAIESFDSLPELMEYYKQHQLTGAGFSKVCTNLVSSHKEALANRTNLRQNEGVVGRCRALYDFSATMPDQLTFHEGDQITIISKVGYRQWWRGRLNNKTGLFPSTYVEEFTSR